MGKPRRRKLRQRRDDPVLDRVLEEVLNGKVDVIPEYADLPRRWREAPSEASVSKHPRERSKEDLEAIYFHLAPILPEAREGLRRLYLELSMNGEPIPDLLQWWNRALRVLGDPPPRRGAPRKIDRDIKVGTMFKLLGTRGYTREDAMDRIAPVKRVSEETIRTIIKNYRISIRS
jgi:hypothetical protein